MARGVVKLVSELGGASVPLDTANFELSIPIGPGVGRSGLIVGTAVDEALKQLQNPVKLVGRGVHFGGGAGEAGKLTDFEYRDLWLADRVGCPDPQQPNKVQWTLEDNRRWTMSLQSFGIMNAQRFANEFEELAQGNFGQFHRIGKLAYLVATTKAPGGNIFADFDEEDFEIFTALEGALFMLTAYFDLFPGRVIKPDGSEFRPKVVFQKDKSQEDLENGFPLQSFSLRGPWPLTLGRLLRQAHCSIVPNNRGEWVLFRLDPRTFPRKVGGYSGGGNPIARDRRRSRAKVHRTFFKSRYELRADFVESGENQGSITSVDDGIVVPVGLTNVVIMPFDVEDPDTGETIRRGTVYPLADAIRAWNADPDQNYSSIFRKSFGTLSYDLIKRGTVGPLLANKLTVEPQLSFRPHPRGRAIAKTIYDFFRRLYQLPKELRDNLGKIKADLIDVRDTRTGKVAPSQVYFDHTAVMTFFPFLIPDDDVDGDGEDDDEVGFATMRPWPVGDANRRLADAEPSPFAKVSVFDQALGLFRISELTDLSGVYGRIVFTTFKQFPKHMVGSDGIPQFLDGCTQDDEFRLSFLFSAEPITASPKNFYFSEGGPPEGVVADGPPMEEHIQQVFAGYAWRDNESRAEISPESGQLEFDGFDLINEKRLESIALGRRQQYYFQADDWIIGRFRAPGYDPTVDIPAGNYGVSITYQKGLFEASYVATQPRPKPIFEFISPDAAELLFRFDEDTF